MITLLIAHISHWIRVIYCDYSMFILPTVGLRFDLLVILLPFGVATTLQHRRKALMARLFASFFSWCSARFGLQEKAFNTTTTATLPQLDCHRCVNKVRGAAELRNNDGFVILHIITDIGGSMIDVAYIYVVHVVEYILKCIFGYFH